MPRVEILIVSYLGDRDWLVHCLNSVRKFCAGFSGVTVLVPEVEQAEFASFRDTHGVRLACYDRQPDSVLWHLDHQRMKSRADVICPEADLILHVDSDCVFTEPATPDDYCLGGRPVHVVKPYSTFRSALPPWRACTEAAVGSAPTFPWGFSEFDALGQVAVRNRGEGFPTVRQAASGRSQPLVSTRRP